MIDEVCYGWQKTLLGMKLVVIEGDLERALGSVWLGGCGQHPPGGTVHTKDIKGGKGEKWEKGNISDITEKIF